MREKIIFVSRTARESQISNYDNCTSAINRFECAVIQHLNIKVMTKKRRSVDILTVKLSPMPGTPTETSFEDVLRFIHGKNYYSPENGKFVELSIMEDSTSNGIIKGLVITTQDSDIPPKRNKRTGEMSSIDIDVNTEGFAYANAFLYDTRRKVLIYEINKNGCFLNLLKELIYNLWNATTDTMKQNPRFNLDFCIIPRRDEYKRMLAMSYYKQLVIELARPSELIDKFISENDTISNWIKATLENAVSGNADTVLLEQSAFSRKLNGAGLSKSLIKTVIDKIIEKVGRSNIQKLIVRGYTEDAEDAGRCKPVNLLTDAFDEYFYITSKQLHNDVQMQERLKGTESVYVKILPELTEIFGN